MTRQKLLYTALKPKRKQGNPCSNNSFYRLFNNCPCVSNSDSSSTTNSDLSTTRRRKQSTGLFLYTKTMNHDPKNSKNIAISTTRRRFFTNIAPHENNQVNSDSQQTQWNQNHDKSKKALRNPALQSVIDEGLNILQSISSDIQAKTKRRLLLSDEDTGPSPDQLREAARIKHFTEDAIELYTSRKGNLFCVMKEPIVIVDVEITKDLRQARVFWSLPYGVLLMDGISAGMRMRSAERMQKVLDERGGVLQGLVHQKMRGYFRPPKIRFVMAEGEMLRRYLKELL